MKSSKTAQLQNLRFRVLSAFHFTFAFKPSEQGALNAHRRRTITSPVTKTDKIVFLASLALSVVLELRIGNKPVKRPIPRDFQNRRIGLASTIHTFDHFDEPGGIRHA
jgi:hypothetical protein